MIRSTRTRVLIIVLILGLVTLGLLTAARADLLQVSGQIVIVPTTRTASIQFASTEHGFTFIGGGSTVGAVCFPCPPNTFPGGTVMQMAFSLSGVDLGGVFTYDGVNYQTGGALGPFANISAQSAGFFVPLASLTTETFVLPVNLTAQFFASTVGPLATINESGTGTLTLTGGELNPGFDVWTPTAVRFDFVAVPEPATWLLLGSSIAGLAFARRKSAA